MKLPPLISWEDIKERLLQIFPEGAPARAYCTRDMAVSTVYTMLYIGAVEGGGYLAPKHVCRMSDDQAALASDAARFEYASDIMKAGSKPRGEPWYSDNTREPIRDETLRNGLLEIGAAIEKPGVPTTSPKPRYALTSSFAALFDPSLHGSKLAAAIAAWRTANLSAAALAKIAVVKAGVSKDPNDFIVTFPNGETRNMKQGDSSMISKHVIEAFAPRFLEKPGVLWLSESGNKVVARDEVLAKKLKLNIDAGKNLPDIILVDVTSTGVLLVFVEVVATDGPMTELRRKELLNLATDAGFPESHTAFVTAYLDRDSAVLRKTLSSVAWNSFVWTASEPDSIIALFGGSTGSPSLLRDLMAKAGGS